MLFMAKLLRIGEGMQIISSSVLPKIKEQDITHNVLKLSRMTSKVSTMKMKRSYSEVRHPLRNSLNLADGERQPAKIERQIPIERFAPFNKSFIDT